MAMSPVEICSNALLMLGAHGINSFSDSNEFAGLAQSLYPTVRDDLFRHHTWNCTIKRVVLSPDPIAPPYEWAYRFQLPTDCLRVMSVGDKEFVNYRLEGRFIFMDESVCQLRYVFKNEDVSSYDPNLVMLLQYAMSARMAYAVTKSSSLAQGAEQMLQMYAKRARAVDGQEDVAEDSTDSRLISVRGVG